MNNTENIDDKDKFFTNCSQENKPIDENIKLVYDTVFKDDDEISITQQSESNFSSNFEHFPAYLNSEDHNKNFANNKVPIKHSGSINVKRSQFYYDNMYNQENSSFKHNPVVPNVQNIQQELHLNLNSTPFYNVSYDRGERRFLTANNLNMNQFVQFNQNTTQENQLSMQENCNPYWRYDYQTQVPPFTMNRDDLCNRSQQHHYSGASKISTTAITNSANDYNSNNSNNYVLIPGYIN